MALASQVFAAVSQDSWQVRHMKQEHGFEDWDALSFFTLHDSDGSRTWTRDDILFLYGLQKDKVVGDGTGMGQYEASQDITDEIRDKVVRTVLDMVDTDNDGIISIDEWKSFMARGGELPDFGLGPGHHGDYEYEYEIHHWLEHHAKDDPEVKNVHPEDVEHEKLFHAHEHGDDVDSHSGSWEKLENIPAKFRRQ
jgi:hypothetical protein